MSNIKQALRDYLLQPQEPADTSFVRMQAAHHGVTEAEILAERNQLRAILNQYVEDRIYFQGLPGTPKFPRIQIIQLGEDPINSLTGSVSLTKVVLMLLAESEGEQNEADEIANVLRTLLHGVCGVIGGENDTADVEDILLTDAQDDKRQLRDNSDDIYRDMQDIEVWYHAYPPGSYAGRPEGSAAGTSGNDYELGGNELELAIEIT